MALLLSIWVLPPLVLGRERSLCAEGSGGEDITHLFTASVWTSLFSFCFHFIFLLHFLFQLLCSSACLSPLSRELSSDPGN